MQGLLHSDFQRAAVEHGERNVQGVMTTGTQLIFQKYQHLMKVNQHFIPSSFFFLAS